MKSLRKNFGKSKLNLIEVPCTNCSKINFDSISKRIKLFKYVLCARDNKGNYIFAFNNSTHESDLLDIVEKLQLNAKYNYYLNLGEKFVILKESIIKGRSETIKESKSYPRHEYNIAKCLA